MEKISLQDPGLDRTNRERYLRSLELAILKLLLKKGTRTCLLTKVPFERHDYQLPQREKHVRRSVLYRLLDKGVIWNVGKPVDKRFFADTEIASWSKSFNVNGTSHRVCDARSERSEMTRYFLRKNITAERLDRAFRDVNQYLDGFGFDISVYPDVWYLGFGSGAFDELMGRQMSALMAKSEAGEE